MGRGVKTGENSMGRGGDGLGARVGSEGIRGDSSKVRVAVGFCVWAREGMSFFHIPEIS